ncbi:LuxR C-terminal-related transcriptional regulator [Lentzea sp. BCCO 10_0061]|uniref:LuxR C-terminal-related transcriptional regulator n=1 Tax=Lentzea sokolovensis TaxID=3095429 RepID=A0ABU4VBR6_9PSEU|nr:LuxR C-terminal-related transcriptional regulator [Lentzea sp. BCCO 10_0061]MDX8149248.1 LuxR C-terminal-related transcriptional regulator [Lentzea sp. BCCO 10_0061]
MLEDVEPHATPRLSGHAELVDAALAALARGEGSVLIAEQHGVLGRRALVSRVRAKAAQAGVRVVHGRATHVDRVAPLSTLRAALSTGTPGSHHDFDVSHLTALREIRTRLMDLSAGQGLLVCLDDFHHADEVTALALRMLVPELAGTPVLWLLSVRRSQASAAVLGVVDVLLEAGARRLPSRWPTGEDVRRLCARVLGAEPDQAVVAIASDLDSDTERVVRALQDAGHVRVADGKAVLASAGQPLPHWLVTEVRSALGDLSGPTAEVLDAGAVLGRRFTVHEAAALLRRPVAELLWAAALLVETGVLAAVTSGLTFRSELVRRVVYAGLTEPVRVALHREAADVVAREGRPADEVVHHLERGGHHGSGAVVDTLRKAVRDRTGSAGLAVRLLDLIRDDTGDLTVDAVRLLGAEGRTEQAWDLAVRALNRTTDAGTETRLVCALAELADARDPGHDHLVVEYARRASARPDLAERDRADLAAVQAYRLAAAGHTEAAANAAALAGSAGGEAVVLGSAARAQIALRRGELGRALELARAAVHEADRAGPPQRGLTSRLWLCAPLVALDRFDEVHSTLDLVARETAQLGASWPVSRWQYHQARAHLAAGRLRSAAAGAELAVLTARESPSSPMLGRALLLLTEIRTALGDVDAAEANLREAEQLGGAGAARLTWRRVLLLCESDRHDEAAEAAEVLLTSADLIAITASAPTPVAPVLVRLARHRADERRVDQIVRVARELSERNPGVLWVAAAAAHATGLRDRDVGAVIRAAELHRHSGRAAAAAAALTDAGQLAFEHGEGRQSRDLLEQAQHRWTAVGAGQRLTPVPDAPDRDPDDPIPSPSLELWASLTETEVRVARLVARGLTNKAIASRLTLSPNTIGTHVRNAFTKLQVTNRVELALQVIAHERKRT